MGMTYFKRFRMEISLVDRHFPDLPLPSGYEMRGWSANLVEAHARSKFESFYNEVDADVFPSLSSYDGCLRLMREIKRKRGFLPVATWLLVFHNTVDGQPEACGTVQGIRDPSGMGSVQNLGVMEKHRGQRLGSALMHRALTGFQQAGLTRAFLEVTAYNAGAVRLYKDMGFRKTRTVYKASELEEAVHAQRGLEAC
jgi:ribosomal protein S18 acetylase RimI-like enzyme